VVRSIYFYTDSHVFGGAEHSLFMLIGQLNRARWRPVLLLEAAEGTAPLAERGVAAGAEVRFIDPLPLGLVGARRAASLARLLRAERPSVFHAHLSWPLAAKFGIAAACIARVPAIVATVQLVPSFDLDRSSRVQLRLLSSRVGRYIAVSSDIALRLTADFGWPSEKISVVYNAVETGRFTGRPQPALRAELTGDDATPLVLTCARLDAQKGHDVLLSAAASLPGVVFAFAGDGPERAQLEARARALGISERVRFLGFRDDIPELLAACDVFALPSFYEGSSLAVLEAMAASRPVVSCAIGGTDELIEDGLSGLLVPPGDAVALTAAIQQLLSDGELRSRLAQHAHDRVMGRFTPMAMAAAVERVYDGLLGDRDRHEPVGG
jgi:glycosyltransferase involved in cell wall biosynthesis